MEEKICPQNIIFDKLHEQEHYLNEKCAYKYYLDFWNCISSLDKAGLFNSRKSVNQFCNKLKIGSKYNVTQYLQGVSELMLWIYCCKQGYSFETDVKVGKNNNTDVDVQIQYKGYVFNIEVKCPTLNPRMPESILKIDTGFRTVDRKRLNHEMTKVEKEVINTLIRNSNGKFNDFQYNKINDTKVLSYLSSCKEKFSMENENTLNVLLIALPSSEVQNYWGYLYNAYSGIFTHGFPNTFFCDKEERYYDIKDIEATDVVILSNIVSGHEKPNDIFDSWNLNNYFNLLCKNIHGRMFKENPNNDAFRLLYELFPNDNLEFEKELEKCIEEQKKSNIPLEPIFLNSFLYDHYKLLL